MTSFADVRPTSDGTFATEDGAFAYVMRSVTDQRGTTTVERIQLAFVERLFELRRRLPDLVVVLERLARKPSYAAMIRALDAELDHPQMSDSGDDVSPDLREAVRICRRALDQPDGQALLYRGPRLSQIPLEYVLAFKGSTPTSSTTVASHVESRHDALEFLARLGARRGRLDTPIRVRLAVAQELLERRKFVKVQLLEFGWPEIVERGGSKLAGRLRDLESAVLNTDTTAELSAWWDGLLADERLVEFLRQPPYFHEVFEEELSTLVVAPSLVAGTPVLKDVADGGGESDSDYLEAVLGLSIVADPSPGESIEDLVPVEVTFERLGDVVEVTGGISLSRLLDMVKTLAASYFRATATYPLRDVMLMEGRSPEELLEELGTELWNGTFGLLPNDWLEQSVLAKHRVRLRIQCGDQRLAALPWEVLRLPTVRVAAGRTLSLSIVRDVKDSVSLVSRRVGRPLRILVAAASPTSAPLAGTEQEIAALSRVLEPAVSLRTVQVEVLSQASTSDVAHMLREFHPHVFHFVGHGAIVEGKGSLLFVSESGEPEVISADQMGTMLQDYGILLAVLNGCDTGSADASLGESVAQVLVRQGVPAAIATSRAVLDDQALWFATEFYRAVADGYPLESAVVEARKAMSTRHWDWSSYVLYSSHGFPLWELRLSETPRASPMPVSSPLSLSSSL
jgi:hypothetical protein